MNLIDSLYYTNIQSNLHPVISTLPISVISRLCVLGGTHIWGGDLVHVLFCVCFERFSGGFEILWGGGNPTGDSWN